MLKCPLKDANRKYVEKNVCLFLVIWGLFLKIKQIKQKLKLSFKWGFRGSGGK